MLVVSEDVEMEERLAVAHGDGLHETSIRAGRGGRVLLLDTTEAGGVRPPNAI